MTHGNTQPDSRLCAAGDHQPSERAGVSAMSSDVSKQRKGASEELPEEALAEEVESSDVLGLARYTDSAEALRDLVIGHKAALIRAGFCESTAEEMAAVMHDSVVDEWF